MLMKENQPPTQSNEDTLPSARSGLSKVRKHHHFLRKIQSNHNVQDQENQPVKRTDQAQQMSVKGHHLMNKMKEIREQDRKAVLTQIENIQWTLQDRYQSNINIIENAINVVDQNKGSLAVGCSKKSKNLSSVERNRIALGLL